MESFEESVYLLDECCHFRLTRAAHGVFSNFHPNRPVFEVNDLVIDDGETGYQMLKHPDDPALQRAIAAARGPREAKRIARSRPISHPDWDDERVRAMRLTLRMKAERCAAMVDAALDATGDRPIVEYSRFDAEWGARPEGGQRLRGRNMLGKLWVELRTQRRTGDPLARAEAWLEGFRVNGRAIAWR